MIALAKNGSGLEAAIRANLDDRALKNGTAWVGKGSDLGTHNPGQGTAELPESLTWLWRDYDPAKTQQEYEMQPEEKAKPVFRVGIVNR